MTDEYVGLVTRTEPDLATQLREYLKFKYMGDCKCGECQLVPASFIERAAAALDVGAKATAEVEMLTKAGIIEVAVRNPSVADYMKHWEARALSAESKVTALEARVDELEAALRPFAEAGGQTPVGHGPDNEPLSEDEPVTISVVGFQLGDVTVKALLNAYRAIPDNRASATGGTASE